MTFVYPAVIRKVSEHNYEGYFPDHVESDFRGDTLDDAIDNALWFLSERISATLEDDDDLPGITDVSTLKLAENESVHNIMAHYQYSTGYY